MGYIATYTKTDKNTENNKRIKTQTINQQHYKKYEKAMAGLTPLPKRGGD
jgi:hypothetical protein